MGGYSCLLTRDGVNPSKILELLSERPGQSNHCCLTRVVHPLIGRSDIGDTGSRSCNDERTIPLLLECISDDLSLIHDGGVVDGDDVLPVFTAAIEDSVILRNTGISYLKDLSGMCLCSM